MYINPFVAGVLTTLFAEALFIIGYGIYAIYKDKKK